MSDNEDLLGDDLGDHSLADYNLGNEEEEQLLADDYDNGGPQNVPLSIGDGYSGAAEVVPNDYTAHSIEYAPPPIQYQPVVETECVVPNITVEVPNLPPRNYAPETRHYEPEHAVPPAMPARQIEPPQIVPSEAIVMPSNGDARERFVAERPSGGQRMPQVRDIPDSLDKVVIPRGGYSRGRTSWRAAHFHPRPSHPYRRNNMHRGNFNQRNSFPPPQVVRPNIPQQIIRQDIRPEIRPEIQPQIIRPEVRPDVIRPEIPRERPGIVRPDLPQEVRLDLHRPEIRPDLRRPELRPELPRPDIHPDLHRPEIRPELHRSDLRPELHRPDIHPEFHRPEMRPELHRPDIRPELHRPEIQPELHRPEIRPDMAPMGPQMGPEISPERPILPDLSFRPHLERPPFQPFPRYQFRAEERPMFGPVRPGFERPMYSNYPRQYNPRFGPTMRDMGPRARGPGPEPEVRMRPLPPPALAGKKVLINPHFKGNFQPPVEGLPAYIPTRIQKSPPLSPTNKLGPIKDIDAAAERFIAEQRTALARAGARKFPPRRSPQRSPRRSPQRYIENTTIEIENDLAGRPPPAPRPCRSEDDDLLRRQEEFINANRAGLRRRMRSPSPSPSPPAPARRSPSPRRRADRPDGPRANSDEDGEYRRRLREQESLRERVLRAKEVRRRRVAAQLTSELRDREREPLEKSAVRADERPEPARAERRVEDVRPDTTRNTPDRKSPEKETAKPKMIQEPKEREKRERSPINHKDDEVNSTCEGLTPPPRSPARTPPRPASEDDDLDMILGDIDGILSDEEDSGRFKEEPGKPEPPKPQPKPVTDLRSKLPPKPAEKPPRQKIIFTERDEPKRKEKSPPRRAVVSSTKGDGADKADKKLKAKKPEPKPELTTLKSRPRITFGNRDREPEKEKLDKSNPFSNRRVILQRNPGKEKPPAAPLRDRAQPSAGIFSRAVRLLGDARPAREPEPQVQYDSDSELDEDSLLNDDVGNVAEVDNLPHGMTDTRLRTLAGADVQSLVLDKEERSAKITFKTSGAAETFRRKFNNKMVAASRLTVALR